MTGREERAKEQALSWVQGVSRHNGVDNECCPDFSCCQPGLFERDQAKRWEYYHKHYGNRQ